MTSSPTDAVLDQLSQFLRFGGHDEDTIRAWLEELESLATSDDLPALLGMLEDDDTTGVLWAVLYIAENLGDAYLTALSQALPQMWQRAPQWSMTAVLRIVNTHNEPDDCIAPFAASVRARPEAQLTLEALLDTLEVEDHLIEGQQAALEALRTALKSSRTSP